VKAWDLVCPSCGATLFTPESPSDGRKVEVDLPSWEMKPARPEPRRQKPERPDTRRPMPAQRIEVPGLPRPPLVEETPAEPAEVLALDDIETIEEDRAPEPRPGQLVKVQRAGDAPLGRAEEEVTQPRARMPQPSPDLVRVSARETLMVEGYDPERLKLILAQAQAEAASRASRKRAMPLSVVIAVIVAVTMIGLALVIALLA